MADEDCEIEYLDEDEDIVQQCVQALPVPDLPQVQQRNTTVSHSIPNPLLVERRPVEKRKKVLVDDDDSDYDPTEDLLLEARREKEDEVELSKVEKKKKTTPRKTPKIYTNMKPHNITLVPRKLHPELKLELNDEPTSFVGKKKEVDIVSRRRLDIRIPDYEDPICLPVKAVNNDEYDAKRLKQWNNLCLDQFRKVDEPLETELGKTISSTRTMVFRNVKNPFSGRIETSLWCKNVLENEEHKKKSDIVQGVLPKYRERNFVAPYQLVKNTRAKDFRTTNEIILTSERHKDEEFLVAYNPQDAISAVYKNVDREKLDESEEKKPIVLKEVCCNKVCNSCYQMSWRGQCKTETKTLKCVICSRVNISVYNLLSHLKTNHTRDEVKPHASRISQVLKGVVDYHYKCKICNEEVPSIISLRKHMRTHRSTGTFKCYVCLRVTS